MLIADVFRCLIIDNVTKEEFASATMESAGFKITSETTDVEGGGGLVAVLHSPRKEEITLKDVRYHFDMLARQLGTTIVVGAGEAYMYPTEYTVVSETTKKIITLEQTPKTSTDVKLYKADKTLIASADYTITGAKVEFTGTGYALGDVISAGSYIFATDAKTETITIDNSKYPKGVTCVLETLEIDEEEVPKNTLQIVFDKCIFDGEISIDTNGAKRDASRHDMNLKVLNKLGASKIAGRIVRIPIA